jgi:hypothetical protein
MIFWWQVRADSCVVEEAWMSRTVQRVEKSGADSSIMNSAAAATFPSHSVKSDAFIHLTAFVGKVRVS